MNQNCFECVYKHLAGALSYAKEVMGGFDKTADLDHEIDFIGQLVNAEHHLQLISKAFYEQVRGFRKSCQSKSMKLEEADIDFLRKIYKEIAEYEQKNIKSTLDTKKSIAQKASPVKLQEQEKYTVVYEKVKDAELFDLSYKTLKLNALNDIKIIVLGSESDLSSYDVEVVDTDLYSLLLSDKVAEENFIYMKENQLITKKFDFNYLFNSYKQAFAENLDFLKNFDIDKKNVYSWDSGKPQLLNKTDYLKIMQGKEQNYLLTTYFLLKKEKPVYNSFYSVVEIDKKLCCSLKQKANSLIFACITNKQQALQSVKNWLKLD